jgi:hypothetical protein
LVAIVVVAIGLVVSPLPASAKPVPNYVALGDSYTAGPLIPLQIAPFGCLKSDHNYPHLVAPSLGLQLRDVSCSGATTDDMWAPQDVSPDGPNPPQLDAIDKNTQVVTIGIGGNDIGFSSVAEDCATADPNTTPCQDKYVVNGHDELRQRIADTAPKVGAVLTEIHRRSRKAHVYVVDYLPILPESGPGCWPSVPIGYGDVGYVRGIEQALNAMLGQQALLHNATFVNAYPSGIGHDACQLPVIRWVEPVVPASPAAPLHPNLFGEQAYAADVSAAIMAA